MLKRTLMTVRDRVRDLALRGHRYECPICEHRYAYLPEGACPGCGSMHRHRILWLWLRRLEDSGRIKLRGKILHVAPERGLSKKLRQNFDYLSVDLNGVNAMQAADITRLDFPDDYFDAIICNHVLEHILDDRSAMSEMYRVLRPGGWASLHVPLSGKQATDEDASVTAPSERLKRFGQEDHVRVYGWDYLERLRRAGFHVEIVTWKDFLPEVQAGTYVAMEDEVILGWKVGASSEAGRPGAAVQAMG